MKTRILTIVVALLCAPALFAGGSQDTASAAKGDVTLTVAIWDKNQEPGLTKIAADFTAATGIKTAIQVTPWEQYWTMLEAGATGGSLPDVFWMHSNEFSKYAEYNMLLDLTKRIANSKKLDISQFPSDITALYNYGKKQFAVPKDIDTIALWYNKTMFDKAALAYPDESWTWDTFRQAAKKLTKKDGSQYGCVIRPDTNQAGWYNIVFDMGGEILSADKKKSGFDKAETIKAITFIEQVIKDGSMPPYNVIAENRGEALFEAGKVAMVTAGSWMLPELCNNDYVKAHCDIAVLPKDTASGRRCSIYNGLGWAASSNTKYPEQAWAFIEYFGSKEAQTKQSDLGIVISAYKGTTKNWVNAYPKFNLKAYLTMMDDMVIRPYSKSTVAWEDMSIQKLIDVWTGKKTAAALCPEIAREMNKLLAEE